MGQEGVFCQVDQCSRDKEVQDFLVYHEGSREEIGEQGRYVLQ